MQWFRCYTSMLHDPKVLRLSDSAYRLFVQCLCLAAQEEAGGDTRHTLADLALVLRREEAETLSALKELQEQGLCELQDGQTVEVVNWEKRQGGGEGSSKASTSTERVRAYRARQKAASKNTPVTDVTLPETQGNKGETLHETKVTPLEKSREEETRGEEEGVVGGVCVSPENGALTQSPPHLPPRLEKRLPFGPPPPSPVAALPEGQACLEGRIAAWKRDFAAKQEPEAEAPALAENPTDAEELHEVATPPDQPTWTQPRAKPMDPGLQLSAAWLEEAEACGFQGQDEVLKIFVKFRDYYAAKPSKSRDWRVPWRRWLARERKYLGEKGFELEGVAA